MPTRAYIRPQPNDRGLALSRAAWTRAQARDSMIPAPILAAVITTLLRLTIAG